MLIVLKHHFIYGGKIMSNTYNNIKISLASPTEILSWSKGEVKKTETINYRTLKPEPTGIFCEKIFGSIKNYQCPCARGKRGVDIEYFCKNCGTEYLTNEESSKMMGHIDLVVPILNPCVYMSLSRLLNLSDMQLKRILYKDLFVVLEPVNTRLLKKQTIDRKEYTQYIESFDGFAAVTGVKAIKFLINDIDYEVFLSELKKELYSDDNDKKQLASIKIELIESILKSDVKLDWLFLERLLILPASQRPLILSDDGTYKCTEINEKYRRIIHCNNMLKRMFSQKAPQLLIDYKERELNDFIKDLFDYFIFENNTSYVKCKDTITLVSGVKPISINSEKNLDQVIIEGKALGLKIEPFSNY